MSLKRHVYRPPRGRMTGIFAILGGMLATMVVFVAIPLSQKLNEQFPKPVEPPPEMTVAPPEDESLAMDEPPPEEQEEPPPEEPLDEPTDLDMDLAVADLPLGTGGGFVMNMPSFAMKGGDMMGGDDLDSGPVPTSKFPPNYPSSLLSKGIGGRVQVSCEIDESGRLVSSKIRQSSGHAELDKAALAAVAKWKFKPGIKGGRKVRASCVVPFNFEVKKN
jgi:protein TonB